MKVIQIRLNAVEEQMLKEVQKRSKVHRDLEALLKNKSRLSIKSLLRGVVDASDELQIA